MSRCFYPGNLPAEYSLTEMIELLGANGEGAGIPARLVISYTLASTISKSGQAAVLSRGHRAIHASEQWYARHDTNLKREVVDWQEVIARAKNGERFLTENMQVMITAARADIVNAEENLKSLYNSKDWLLEVNRHLQYGGD